ncbi:MAG: RecQ family ATP-dependent DNA helicase, partial [Prevotella sp.]
MIQESSQSSSSCTLPENWEKKCGEVLSRYWGFDSFRGIQGDIINSIGCGRDTLGLMPTGGGKSITFQVPALVKEGVCVVITPLVALMKDQVINLKKRGIKAAAVFSDLSHEDILTTLDNCVFGAIKILYVSPERLATPLFQTKFKHMKVSFITIDEAHCISQWGYDFRPSYLHIADVRRLHPEVPVLALTATATPFVVEDIQKKLCFAEPCVFRMSFERKNLSYVVRNVMDKYEELAHILQCVDGSAVVYVRSRRRSKEVAEFLCSKGLNSTYYHAGLDAPVKDSRQKAWLSDEVRIIVATNAFGMGIDKPDV